MGCSNSNAFEKTFHTILFQTWMRQFTAMQLSKREIKTLWNIFTKIDFDNSGSIGLAELLAHIDLERTRFTEKIFSIFDEDKSGEVDFREFVLSLWNYCTLTKATLDMFAFDLYDKDSSGELSPSEVERMLQDIYGKQESKTNFLAKNVANDLKDIEKAGNIFDIQQFREFARTHQALLFPAFQMQLALQQKILGVGFWERNANKRLKFSNGKYISVGNFILYNVDGTRKPILEGGAVSVATTAVAKAGGRDGHLNAAQTDKLMELAGTRAARRSSVVLNERRLSSAAEIFADKGAANHDASMPMNEASKKAWLAAVLNGANISPSKQSAAGGSNKKKSAKGAVQVPVLPRGSRDAGTSSNTNSSGGSGAPGQSSSGIAGALGRMGRSFFGNPNSQETRDKPPVGERRRNSNSNAVVAVETVGDSSGGDPQRRNSRENDDLDVAVAGTGTGSGKPRRNSKDNNMYIEPGSGSGGRVRRKSLDREPGQGTNGRVKIATLTMDAIQQIDEVNPIEAWRRQPVGGQGRRKSKAESAEMPAGSAKVGAGAGLGIAISTKASVNPQMFDSGETKQQSALTQPVRRASLSVHPQVHSSTWTAAGSSSKPSATATANANAGIAAGVGIGAGGGSAVADSNTKAIMPRRMSMY